MSEINDKKVNSYYESLTWDSARKAKAKEITRQNHNKLGKNEFMKLLITQLQHQDPLQPQDNVAYIAQLAQFSSLEGIQNLNKSVGNFGGTLRSSQALQASALVGRKVAVETNTARLPKAGYVVGDFNVNKKYSEMRLRVTNEKGGMVREVIFDASKVQMGKNSFAWDGHDNDGKKVKEGGIYKFAVIGYDAKAGTQVNIPLTMQVNIDSVSLGKPGEGSRIMLNIAGVGSIPLEKVKDFY